MSIPLENVRKTKGFPTFSEGMKMEHWTKMGLFN